MAGAVEFLLLLFFGVSGLCLAGLFLYLRSYPVQIRGIRSFRALIVLMTVWSFSAVGKIVLPVPIERVLVALELPLGVLFVVVFFIFASQYTGRNWHERRDVIGVVAGAILLLAVGLVTNPRHQLLWASIDLSTAGFPHLVHTDLGPLYFAYVALAYGIYGFAVYALVDLHIRSRYSTVPIVLIVLGSSLPLLVNLVSVLDSAPVPGLDYTPSGLAAFGVATAWAIQMDFFDIVPVARDTAVEQSNDGMVILDAQRRVRDYNPTAAELIPALTEHENEPIDRVIPDAGKWFEALGGTERKLGPIGEDRQYLSVQMSRIADGPHHLGWTATISDITDQQRRQRHLQLVSRVLRHNMANRINTVVGHADLLEEHVDEAGRPHLQAIDDSATSIIETSEKLRTIQQIVTGGHTVSPVPVYATVDSIAADYRASHPAAKISVECPEDISVRCGSGFQATVENLVENAILHNPDPEPSVTVRVTADNDCVAVSVTDDGPGIPESERQVLQAGETPLQHSCGVGLWLVHCFVEQSGRDLRFEPAPDGGSKVTVTLDRAGVDSTH